MKNITRADGRWLEVPPERFGRWIASFARRHGADGHGADGHDADGHGANGDAGHGVGYSADHPAGRDAVRTADRNVGNDAETPDSALTVNVTSDGVIFTAPDGATARCVPPFWESGAALPRYPDTPTPPDSPAPEAGAGTAREVTPEAASALAEAIAERALGERTVGVLLVRLGGYAAGVFTGSPPLLVAHKTGSRLVHGRSAAGGWSQQRFARRREKQASEALGAAAKAAGEVFGRWGAAVIRSGEKEGAAGAGGTRGTGLDVVVFGGDKRAVAEVAADPRLAPYAALAADRFLTVPDPKFAVLRDSPRLFLAVRIFLTEPAS